MIGRCEVFEEVGFVIDRVGGKARMQVVDHLEISAPAAEGQVAGADEKVALVFGGQYRDFGMKDTCANRDRLDVIVLAHPARALFAQSRSNAFDICKNERLTPAPAYKRVEDYSFKE